MRPRSRLLSKRGLPTIREGQEGQVQDLNQINSFHPLCPAHSEAPSPKDYLQSICQLARPTFPLRGSGYHARTLDPLRPGQGLPQIPPLTRPPTPTIHRAVRVEEEVRKEAGLAAFSDISVQESEVCAEGIVRSYHYHGNGDPLEYLYGHRGSPAPATCQVQEIKEFTAGGRESKEGGVTQEHPPLERAHGLPHLCSQRSNSYRVSCPGLRLQAPHSPTPAPAQPYTPKEKKRSSSRFPSRGSQSSATTGGRVNCGGCMDKRSMVSHWIADCRHAWREARTRACMLPAIAEI